MRNDILVPFVNETIAALESMANLKGESDILTYRDPLDVFIFKGFAVCIAAKTSSGISGKIVMNYDNQTAVAIGNRILTKMLGSFEGATELNDMVRDALAEFSNTAVGLATRHISEARHKIIFGAPVYLLNKEDCEFLLAGVKQIMTIPVDVKNIGRFYFSFLLQSNGE
ncbi:MAG: hypothetical protein A2V90_08245 [Gammaproteobacteria bacterium RBG_16_57_12]|nr:MAG: hypothetical protein A2V90_08245 [Gammaproteobacteria bacterium RBG_16_57_12]